jgi:hypothetical protein
MSDRAGYNVEYDDAGTVVIDEASSGPDLAPVLAEAPTDGMGCHSGATMRHVPPANPIFWTNTPRIIPKAPMTNRNPCARPLGHCGWACG